MHRMSNESDVRSMKGWQGDRGRGGRGRSLIVAKNGEEGATGLGVRKGKGWAEMCVVWRDSATAAKQGGLHARHLRVYTQILACQSAAKSCSVGGNNSIPRVGRDFFSTAVVPGASHCRRGGGKAGVNPLQHRGFPILQVEQG